MRVSTALAEADAICDYIPIISTLSNIVVVALKCIYACLPESITKDRYWTHIHEKSLWRCLILLVPLLGNLYVLISDYQEYQEQKPWQDPVNRETTYLQDWAATRYQEVTGHETSPEQLSSAPTVEQLFLWVACCETDAQAVRDSLAQGVSPTFAHQGKSPLVAACQYGTAEIVQLVVEAGADVNATDAFGNTPFVVACSTGDLDKIHALRPQVQDVNAPNGMGYTPLMAAAESGNQPAVQFLLSQGANRTARIPDTMQGSSTDALSCAIAKDHAHLLPLLLSAEENVDEHTYWRKGTSGEMETQPLLLTALALGAQRSALTLMERSNIQLRDSKLNSALHYATSKIALLRAVLQKSHAPEFVNTRNREGSTPLHEALLKKDPAVALALLEYGADPFIANDKGETPFAMACEKELAGVLEAIQARYPERITATMGETMRRAIQAARSRMSQASEPPAENTPSSSQPLEIADLQTLSFSDLISGPRLSPAAEGHLMASFARAEAEQRAQDIQTREERGSAPRTGMELLFGRITGEPLRA